MYFQPLTHDFEPLPDRDAEWPVIVAGAGPVGLTAALGLAQRGIEVLVLEAGDAVSYGSRAICVSRNSLQILDRLGAGQRFLDAALPWTGGRSYYRNQQVLQFEMPAAAEYARPPMVNLSQSVAEQILLEQVQRETLVTVRWRCSARQVAQDDRGVEVGIDTPGGSVTARARWLVGADGARSAVRAALGVGLSGTSYEGRYVIADIHWPSDWPTERRVWFDPPSNPGATIIMHRQPDDIWRVDYQLRAEDDAEREVAEDRVRARIERHLRWLGNEVPWSLEWVSLYRAHALSAESYRHGRVLLAGDAAHLVPIFGVRGLNSGLEDADDLAWKLALVEDGASDRLLDSYSAERRDAWAQNIASARKSTLFMTPGTPGYRMTRDAALLLAAHDPVFSHLLNPRQSSATHARRSPITFATPAVDGTVRPGDMVDDRRLSAGELDGATSPTLHEAIGTGFAVLGIGVGQDVVEDAGSRARHAIGSALPVAGAVVAAGTGLADALGAQPGTLVVLRPDGRILGRARDADGIAAMLDGVRRGRSDAPCADVPDPVLDGPEVVAVERAWESLSELLDATAGEDREQTLLRLALLLARKVEAPELSAAIEAARAAG